MATIRTKRNFISVGKDSCEVLVDGVFKFFISQLSTILLKILDDLDRIGINSVQVLDVRGVSDDLFPNNRSEIEGDRRFGENRESNQTPKVFEHQQMAWTL